MCLGHLFWQVCDSTERSSRPGPASSFGTKDDVVRGESVVQIYDQLLMMFLLLFLMLLCLLVDIES